LTLLKNGIDEEAPKDKFMLVYIIMAIQGAGTLFPWNAFISAPDYFKYI
jgi:equilibrative nucleoside transporter 1/2/3